MAEYSEEIIEELLERLRCGDSLLQICADKRMPDRRTIQRWSRADDDLATRIRDAREIGYLTLGEKAFLKAQVCEDPIKGRLAFDAARWYLGKLSNAFAEKPVALGALVNVDAGDAFGPIAAALERAAASIGSGRDSTRAVVVDGAARPADAAGSLADLAGDGGQGLGQD